MIKSRYAFTLIELLIALSISSFIIFAMIQSQRNVMRFVDRTSTVMRINRRITLLFDQMERDFSLSFIPSLAKKEHMPSPTDLSEQQQDTAKTESKDKNVEASPTKSPDQKKKINDKKWFFAQADENEIERVGNTKHLLCKDVSFITTSSMQIFGERVAHFVRVRYQLIPYKTGQSSEKRAYELIRFETTDLENVTATQPEDQDKHARVYTYRRHVVARNIKHLSLKYHLPKPQAKDHKNDRKEEPEEVIHFQWGGQDKQTRDIVPQKVTIRVVLWENNKKKTHVFSCEVPIILFVPKKLDKQHEKDQLPNKTVIEQRGTQKDIPALGSER